MKLGLSQWRVRAWAHSRQSRKKNEGPLDRRLVPFLRETTLTLDFVCFSPLRYVSQWHFRACARSRRSRPEKRGSPRQADARRTMKTDLAVRTPVKNAFEATRLDPVHGGSAFWELLPRLLGVAFNRFCFRNAIDVVRNRYLLRNISAGRLQGAAVFLFSVN